MKNASHVLKFFLPLILFPVFFILHGYNENFGLIPVLVLSSLLLKYILITAGIYFLSFLLLRTPQKAFIFTFYGLLLYFFFGFFHDLASGFLKRSFFVSYTFLLPFIFFISLAVLFLLWKSRKNFYGLVRYIRYLLVLFVVYEIIILSSGYFTNKKEKNNLAQRGNHVELLKDEPCEAVKPDIFFIVLDEYASSASMRKYFGYDNSAMDSLFRTYGFFVADSARSNYNFTTFSLAAALNFGYLDLNKADSLFPHRKLLQSIETFRANRFTSFLRQKKYELINYGCFLVSGTDLKTYADFEWLPKQMLDNQTLSSRIRDDIGWRLQIKNIFTGEFTIPKSFWTKKKKHLSRNEFNLNGLKKELKRDTDHPRFVYTHLMLPHEPYYLDAAGRPVSDTAVYLNTILPEVGYFQQLAYTNSLLRELIPLAVSGKGRNRIVIVMGDHGIRFHNEVSTKEMEFENLLAVYLPDKNYQSLYSSISPVNLFRVLLNQYFCQEFPLSEDRFFYMKQKGRY